MTEARDYAEPQNACPRCHRAAQVTVTEVWVSVYCSACGARSVSPSSAAVAEAVAHRMRQKKREEEEADGA